MSTQFYVLMYLDYQENEGILYRSSGSGGYPKIVFTSKKKADEVALQKNLFEFESLIRDSVIRNYASHLDEIISSKTLEDDLLFEEGIFMTLFNQTAEDWWNSLRILKYGDRLPLKVEPSPEQWQKLYDCFNLRFWKVIAVDKG